MGQPFIINLVAIPKTNTTMNINLKASKRLQIKCLLFCMGCLLLIANINAQKSNIKDSIETYLAKHNFNGSILICSKDTLVYEGHFGLANREFHIANSSRTRHKIASISKLFTSVMIYQLYEKGSLELKSPIKKYLPDYKGAGADKVSIYQLVTGTSGIEDLEKDGDMVYEKRFTSDEILEKYASGTLDTIPGTKFNYNNADFIILGKVLENIYGQPIKKILQSQILDPIGMENTGLLDYEVVEDLANSYRWNDSLNIVERDIPYYPENYFTSGGFYSTAEDLMKFGQALYNKKIINPSTLDRLLKPELESYASGLWVFDLSLDEQTTHKVALRPGGIWGTESLLMQLIDKDVTMVIVSNMMGTANRRDLEFILFKSF